MSTETSDPSSYFAFLKLPNIALGCLLAGGLSNAEMAVMLNLSESRVKQRVSRVLREGGYRNRTEYAVACKELMQKPGLEEPENILEWYNKK